MAQSTALLIDDRDPQIRYICFSYSQLGAKSYYQNSWTTSEPGDNCSDGWFSYTFNGTGVRVAAYILAPTANYTVRLDDADFVPQSGQGSYISPILPDGQHTITYALPQTEFSLPFLDYLAITPGPSTSLQGRTLAVDDTDNSITFSGSWKDSLSVPLTFYDASLYGGTAHWSSNVGDSLQFKFEGSSISVFGIASNISDGNITARYTLDGQSFLSGLPEGTIDSSPFVQLFHADVQSGLHTLVINITEIQTPQALGIDLIAYNASFNSISSLPTFSSSKPKSALNAGSKAGITVGVLAFAAIVAGLLLFLRKRYARPRNPKFRLYDTFEPGDRKSSFPLQPGKQTFPL